MLGTTKKWLVAGGCRCSASDQSQASVVAKPRQERRDSFLSPVAIDELLDPSGPCASESEQRCSDKGFLAMPLERYLELLDWTAPAIRSWQARQNTGERPDAVDAMRIHRTHRRYHLRRRAREIFAIAD
ncbi:hypothetical protein [Allorhodopirellula solitaria]|uniref:hypothetical protein n=1 Tax=Allorhodopirellula solitaria TaxID=2527987 RepID=UPI001FE4D2FA|nr:hypothetical protein [Allorhodopirellula solitaria]